MAQPEALTFTLDDPRARDVQTLLSRHLAFTSAASPPEDMHALDTAGLLEPSVTFVSGRAGDQLVVVGALSELDDQHAEIKSMHVDERCRGTGAGSAMVQHLVARARERGMRRVSLETGTMPEFAPARAMYAKAGFVPCGPFAAYEASPHSTFMTLRIAPRR